MPGKYDQFGKASLDAVLEGSGQVHCEAEVRVHPQAVDVVVSPAPGAAAPLARLGLLGRMVRQGALIELVSRAPGDDLLLGSLRKQLNWAHCRATEAGHDRMGRVLTRLWIVCAGRPSRVIERRQARPLPVWGPGVYGWTAPCPAGLVVLPELPVSEDTLLLRVLGRGRVLHQALSELLARPSDDWLRRRLVPVLAGPGRGILERIGRGDPTDRELVMRFREQIKEYERGLREEGREEGRVEMLLRQLHRRFGELPADVEERVRSATSEAIDLWAERVLTASTLDEVLAD